MSSSITTKSCDTDGAEDWVSELAPRRYQKGLSYTVGWLTAMGWQVCLASICFVSVHFLDAKSALTKTQQAGIVTQGLIQLNNPDYVFHNWHGTLLSMAYMVFASVFNTVLATKLPLTEGLMLILHVAGLFAIIIPLWVMFVGYLRLFSIVAPARAYDQC